MKYAGVISGSIAVLITITGCGGGSSSPSGPVPVPSTPGGQPAAIAVANQAFPDYGYPAGVAEFGTSGTTPLRVLPVTPMQIGSDSSGDLFVASTNGTIAEYAPGSSTPERSLTGIVNPRAMVVDASGDLFVADAGVGTAGEVLEYTPQDTSPSRTISSGIASPQFVGVDKNGLVYVLNLPRSATPTLTEYGPGNGSPQTTVTLQSSLSYTAMAVDPANATAYVEDTTGLVAYAAGAATPGTTLIQGSSWLLALALGPQGQVYAARANGAGTVLISIFAFASTTPQQQYTAYTSGSGGYGFMAADSQGDLYIIDDTDPFRNTTNITEYSSTGQVVRTIKDTSVTQATGIAIL